jgi:primosomal replication protein N
LNHTVISGLVVQREALRYTPAGLPVLQFQLSHNETVIEAGLERQVAFEINVVLLGDLANMHQHLPISAQLEIEGFIAPTRKNAARLTLHGQHIRPIETNLKGN